MRRLSTLNFENKLTSEREKTLNFEIMASAKLNRAIKYKVNNDVHKKYLRSLYYNVTNDVVLFVSSEQHSTVTFVFTVLNISRGGGNDLLF